MRLPLFGRINGERNFGDSFGLDLIQHGNHPPLVNLWIRLDINGQVGVGSKSANQLFTHLRKRIGFFIHADVPRLVNLNVEDIRFRLRAGGDCRWEVHPEDLSPLHREADHDERREQKEHHVDQRNDLDASLPDTSDGSTPSSVHNYFSLGLTANETLCTPA